MPLALHKGLLFFLGIAILVASLTFAGTKVPLERSTDLRTRSNISAQEIDAVLEGTNLTGLGRFFVEAERRYGVNAIFLASVAVLESGWGTSRIYLDKNNLFGFRAYTATPYESARVFASPRDSILTVAEYLSKEYLHPDGKWFSGYTVEAIGSKYADDPEWADKVLAVAARFNRQITK